MIVHYLMRTESITVTQALKRFAEARPPGIYKPDYTDALYSFYHEKDRDMFVCPSVLEWKRSTEFDLNGDALPDDDDDRDSAAHPQGQQETEAVMKNDDILGDGIPSYQQDTFRQFCYEALKLTGGV